VKVIKTFNTSCPAIKNHSAVFYNSHIYIFGGIFRNSDIFINLILSNAGYDS